MKKMYLLLIPLFALVLLVGCVAKTPKAPAPGTAGIGTWNGTMLTGQHWVVLKTSKGDITLELDADAAPKTVTNFIALAKTGYYDGLTFHRIIPDFMIQGGDPGGNGKGGESIYGPTFEDEINANSYGLDKQKLKDVVEGDVPAELKDATVKDYLSLQGYRYNDKLTSIPMARGAIAMANRGPNTNGSQFFIIQAKGGTPWLNGKHTVFGKVTKGMDVVDAIAASPRDANDMPKDPITYTVELKN